MSIATTITIENAEMLPTLLLYDEDMEPPEPYELHMFRVEVEPQDVRRIFGALPPTRLQGVSVLNVDDCQYGTANENGLYTLTIHPDNAELISLGSEPVLIICGTFERGVVSRRRRPGDEEFLTALPGDLKALGTDLVNLIRVEHTGELFFNPATKRYVETPDRWFTIKPQARSKNFAITVRGRPSTYAGIGNDEFRATEHENSLVVERIERGAVELKLDAGGASRFVLTDGGQLEATMHVLRTAATRRK